MNNISIINLNRFILLLEHTGLTTSQVIYLFCTISNNEELKEKYLNLIDATDEQFLSMLKDMQWIDPDTNIPTDKMRHYFDTSYDRADIFYNTYPDFWELGGSMIGLKTVDDLEVKKYYRNIVTRGLVEVHKEMMEILHFGINNDLIMIPIMDFLKSKQYIGIKKIMLSQKSNSSEETVEL